MKQCQFNPMAGREQTSGAMIIIRLNNIHIYCRQSALFIAIIITIRLQCSKNEKLVYIDFKMVIVFFKVEIQ